MIKKHVPAKLRRIVRQRALGYCEYCLCPEFCATQRHSNEHIIPESLGGTTTEDNLALACQGCNSAKASKTRALDPATGKMTPLFHPRQDIWHEHFMWSSDYLHLVGLTPKGRVTIHELDLNRAGVVHLRHLLILNNEHPPIHRLAGR